MTTAFRAFAVLGMLWTIGVAWLMLAVQDNVLSSLGYVLLLVTLGGTLFGRLYALRRWAAILVGAYLVWNAALSFPSGIWQWTGACTAAALSYAIVLWHGWRSLRSGF